MCPYCGNVVRSDERNCSSCGAANKLYVVDTPRTVFLPKTIEELQEYCAERGMPLLRMRFFIGEDYREPKAFGIYRDGDEVVVYKNKANGERAIRYRGRDEAYGVNELFQKLLDECHKRGNYPDGESVAGRAISRSGADSSERRQSKNGYSADGSRPPAGVWFVIAFLAIVLFLVFVLPGIKTCVKQVNLGYYDFGDGGLYYTAASSHSATSVRWYYTPDDDPSGTWHSWGSDLVLRDGSTPEKPRAFFLGSKYQEAWGFSAYAWERDAANLSGYYRFNEDALFYLDSMGDEQSNIDSFLHYYSVYMTSDDRPGGSWYKLETDDGDRDYYLRMKDGSSYHFRKYVTFDTIDDHYLGKDYREEWGFSPALIPEYAPGYYDFGDGRLYYCDSKVWASGEHMWYYRDHGTWDSASSDTITLSDGNPIPTEDYSAGYLGTDWDSDWGGTSFSSSSFSHDSSSSSYSDWDSDDTDWDSDW